MSKIVILDIATVTKGDLAFDAISNLAPTSTYEITKPEEVIERVKDSEIIITNKVAFPKDVIEQLPNLKLIAIFATGYDSIDIEACRKHNISVVNVADYSSYSVVQTIFAHLLNLTQKINQHDEFVHNGDWAKSEIFSCWQGKLHELAGQTFGIIGFGNIGRKLAILAEALAMKVIIHTAHPEKYTDYDFNFVQMDELLSNSDIISLNLPATTDNEGFINKSSLAKMKKSAILINCSRGKLINEVDLADSLNNEQIAYACLDVLATEPPKADNPLLSAKNCQITPHIAWATIEARARIIKETALNIEAFLNGEKRNNIT
ncbi:MAG: D-2-hydroxyacid dehydrogenase [Rickettsiales bacterium]|jgi:glycerate dehydrogenase|nr:D-2-hydroxyacid dehydrogenase [Rickettsiales bacterium]